MSDYPARKLELVVYRAEHDGAASRDPAELLGRAGAALEAAR